jgi:hypothetical protein
VCVCGWGCVGVCVWVCVCVCVGVCVCVCVRASAQRWTNPRIPHTVNTALTALLARDLIDLRAHGSLPIALECPQRVSECVVSMFVHMR